MPAGSRAETRYIGKSLDVDQRVREHETEEEMKVVLKRFIANQLGHSSGIFSGLTAKFMNRNTSRLNEVEVQLLDTKPTDRALDIGFGGGIVMARMSKLEREIADERN